MEDLAYVLILGVEKTDSGNLKLSAQIGLPNQEPGAGGDQPAVDLLIAEGRDMSEAIDNMFLLSTKRPSLNHLRFVVVSEDLAREGLGDIMDRLRREVRVRLSIRIAVTPEDIEELLKIEEPLSSQPSLAIIDQFENNAERSRMVRAEFMTLIYELLEPDRQAVLPIIESGDNRFSLGKTAIFKDDRMVAIADKNQTFGLLLWKNEIRGGVITMPQVGASRLVSFRIISSKTKTKVRWADDQLHVQVNVFPELDIFELEGPLVDLKNRADHYFVNRLKDTLELAQKEGTDFLQLAARLRREDPQAWQAQKENWADVLRNAQFDLRSNTHIRGQGLVR
jgi:spore germination protein KC